MIKKRENEKALKTTKFKTMFESGEIHWIASIYADLSERYTAILEPLNIRELNKVPFDGSWTAAQVIHHIAKANHSGFLSANGKKAI